MANPETALMHRIREAVNRTGRARVVRNAIGFDPLINTRYGLGTGSADLVGMLIPTGRVFCLEIKTTTGRPTAEQLAWLSVVRKHGGFAAIVRSVQDALDAIDAAESGATNLPGRNE